MCLCQVNLRNSSNMSGHLDTSSKTHHMTAITLVAYGVLTGAHPNKVTTHKVSLRINNSGRCCHLRLR